MRHYENDQYYEKPDAMMDTGFTNYERLMVELNNQMYYDEDTYGKFLNENGLDADATYDKNTDHAQLLETVYAIMETLYNNIDLFRKVETEFATVSEAASAIQSRLKHLRSEIDRIKADMQYHDSDFSFMYFTR